MTLKSTSAGTGRKKPYAISPLFWLFLTAAASVIQFRFQFVAVSTINLTSVLEGNFHETTKAHERHFETMEFQARNAPETIVNVTSLEIAVNCSALKSKLLDYIEVAPMKSNYPKILCFIMVGKSRHSTRVKAVRETWGKRCDKLIIASNKKDKDLGAIKIHGVRSDYASLWQKLNKTVHFIWKQYRDDYEWFFKVDDDSYVIVENLKEFLASSHIQQANANNESLLLGRRINPPIEAFGGWRGDVLGFNETGLNKDFGDRFLKKFGNNATLVFNQGGAGYVMNRKFMSLLVQALDSTDVLRGKVPEDLAVTITMMYRDVFPRPTRDEQGRERFHPEDPEYMFSKAAKRNIWLTKAHEMIGGLSYGYKCCSKKSITFHHVQDLWPLEHQLYTCHRAT